MPRSPVLVKTTSGWVEGFQRGRTRIWKGIPYASAPMGDLRFRAPHPPEPWGGTKITVNWGPMAPQPKLGVLSGVSSSREMSEDCLNLNVWSPASDGARRPVMVFVHGGAYVEGAGSMPDYEGTNLSQRGDLVIVTLNYRLGALGQMDFSSFSDEDNIFESNLGVRDQVAALTWVRDNIAAFGGDPDRVTIFGESAGGNAITTLLTTPAARGLFSGAIAQSPNPTTAHSSGRKTEHADQLLRRLGVDPTDLPAVATALQEVRASDLVRLGGQLQDEVARREPGVVVMSPSMDGDYLPKYPMDAFRAKESHPVPLMIGTNRDEATLFRRLKLAILPTSRAGLLEMLRQTDPGAVDRILAAYPAPHSSRTWVDATTDGVFRVPAIEVAESHATHSPTWMYRFDWASVLMRVTGLRAAHTSELPFVFGNFHAGAGRLFTTLMSVPTRRRVHRRIAGHWLRFARHSDPGTATSPWPAYTGDRRRTMIFAPDTRVEDDPQSMERLGWTGVARHH
ncbi:MAG: hypothetical protein JWQ43_518 [Glaciihabitans sp.]|nr:hypothetical protein [Glaciihabitans sp.]